MRDTVCGLAVALITATITSAAWAQESQPATPQGSPKAPEGRVSIVEEDVWIILSDEPSRHFHQARADFFRQDSLGAATELLKGAAFVKLEADLAGGEAKQALMASVRALDMLAYNVQMGGTVYVLDFDREFARAEAAMADHHFRKAKESWDKKEAKNTGLYLKAAIVALGNGWGWSGQRPEPGTVTVIKETDVVASQLVGGSGWKAEEVTVEIDKVGTEVGKLGKLTAQAKK
jgi:hypothetical protein